MLGLCHSVYWTVHDLCELVGVPLEEVDFHSAGRQPPGVGAALGARRRRASTRCWTQRIAADPELRRRVRVDMYRRLGYYPTETSEHSSEYVAVVPARTTREIERLRIPVGDYLGISAENLAEYAALRAGLAAGTRCPSTWTRRTPRSTRRR